MIDVDPNKNPSNEPVVVLHSGGQDSTTVLGLAIQAYRPENVYPVMFDYNQRHRYEVSQAALISQRLGTQVALCFPIGVLSMIGGSALTDENVEIEAEATTIGGNVYAAAHGLPSTFVPGRNLLFLTVAAAYAAKIGARTIMTGVCQTDAAGYPDCREEFVVAARQAISTALDETIDVVAPLLHMDKAFTFGLADSLGILDLVVDETLTCYNGDRETRNEWGMGCGTCPACEERAKGWQGFQVMKASQA